MQKTNNIEAVIFDWVGTLIDYGCIAPTKVFVEVFGKYGINISMEDARGPMGMAKLDHLRILTGLPHVQEAWQKEYGRPVTESDVIKMYAELEPNLSKVVKDYCTPIPGIVSLFAYLREQNIKIGSTTGYVSEMMKNVIPAAKENGIHPDSIVTSSDVTKGRPFPFMCYQNAINLEVSPMWKMVKIGDTETDIKEGLNAGMWTIGFTKCGNGVGLSEEEIAGLDADTLSNKVEEARSKLLAAGAHYVVEGPWECMPVLEEINLEIENNNKPQ